MKLSQVLACLGFGSFMAGCAIGPGTSSGAGYTANESPSEIAAMAIGGALTSSLPLPSPSPTPSAGVCPGFGWGGKCDASTSSSLTFLYDSCKRVNAAADTWSGSEILVFTGSSSCPTTQVPFTALRLFSAGTTELAANGKMKVTLDTTTASSSGWDPGVPGVGNGTTIAFTTGARRNITIQGLHLVATLHDDSSGLDSSVWNYTLNSDTIVVNGIGSTQVVSSGTVNVQNNIARWTATSAITQALQYGESQNCCYPTSGEITTTYSASGSKSGKEKLTFLSTCGQATLVNTNGTSSTVGFAHCF